MSQTTTIWTKSDIDGWTYPSSLPSAEPIQIGTTTKCIGVNNFSKYYIYLKTSTTEQPFATIEPWSITPININDVGKIYIQVSNELGTIDALQTSLVSSEKIYVVLYANEQSQKTVYLNPTVNVLSQPAISGDVNATITGGVEITGTTDVNIKNSQVPVTQVAGSTFTVDPNGGNVTVANNVPVTLTDSQVTLDSNSTVLNEYISVGPGPASKQGTLSLNAQSKNLVAIDIPVSHYSGCSIHVSSQNGNLGNLNFALAQVRQDLFTDASWYVPSNNTFVFYPQNDQKNYSAMSNELPFEGAYVASSLVIQAETKDGTSITDTLTIDMYPIYAGDYTADNPIFNQSNVGEFDTVEFFNVPINSNFSSSTILQSSTGGYIKKIFLSLASVGVANSKGCAVQLNFQGQSSYTMALAIPDQTGDSGYLPTIDREMLDFGNGVANTGLQIQGAYTPTGCNASCQGYIVIGQQNAPQVPKTIQ